MKTFLNIADNNFNNNARIYTFTNSPTCNIWTSYFGLCRNVWRDKKRFIEAKKRLNECPLGSAALAGTSFPIDRFFTSDN